MAGWAGSQSSPFGEKDGGDFPEEDNKKASEKVDAFLEAFV